jgi:hypothetical protein
MPSCRVERAGAGFLASPELLGRSAYIRHPFDELSREPDNQLGLVELDPVCTSRGDHMATMRRAAGQPSVRRDLLRRLVTAGNHGQRHLRRRAQAGDRSTLAFEHFQVIGHRSEALRLAPERLDDWVHVGGQLSDFADQPLERSRRCRSERLGDLSSRAGRSAGQEREGRTNEADPGEQDAKSRQIPGSTQHANMPCRLRQPFGRRIDKNEPCHVSRMPCRVGERQEAAERMSDEHRSRARRYVLEHARKLVDDLIEASWARGPIAPGEAGPIVRADLGEFGDLRLHQRPADRGRGNPRFQDDDRAPAPLAADVEAMAADVNQLTGRLVSSTALSSGDRLVKYAHRQKRSEDAKNGHTSIVKVCGQSRNLDRRAIDQPAGRYQREALGIPRGARKLDWPRPGTCRATIGGRPSPRTRTLWTRAGLPSRTADSSITGPKDGGIAGGATIIVPAMRDAASTASASGALVLHWPETTSVAPATSGTERATGQMVPSRRSVVRRRYRSSSASSSASRSSRRSC